MKFEDYFDFQAPNDIRLKGTRVGIERILYDYIHRGWSPEQIEETYRHALTLEQVYATITYYLHNKEEISQYLTEWIEHGNRMRAEQGTRIQQRSDYVKFVKNTEAYATILKPKKRHERT